MFRWGIIFLVIALIAPHWVLVDWLVRLPARRKSSSSSGSCSSWSACSWAVNDPSRQL
ncbi:Uncharacterised protein [Salmonella enterica subsp. enterica]|uniref:Uncharacterized protein n=1 Tax=Salmonella enterica I TaxID=59201 RepID=A0A379X0N4_SALET|nr:Uncharacterised protein [Salmonella enterica subsp. enterica]